MANMKKKKLIKSSAKQSVAELLKQAEKAWKQKKYPRSKRYVKMLMDLVKKHKVKLTKDQKNSFCRKCLRWWEIPSTLVLLFDKKHNCLKLKCKCGHTRRL